MLSDFFCVIKLTTTMAMIDSGSANNIGSMANQGYTSISTSFPVKALHKPTAPASALWKNNMAIKLANAPVHRLANAPSFVAFFQYKEQK